MKRTMLTCLVAMLALSCASSQEAKAKSFWDRINPFRMFQSDEAEVATTELSTATEEERLEAIRQRLAERGLDEATIEARIADMTAARESGEAPSLDDIRAKLEERGIDTATLEARIADMNAARESGTVDFAALRESGDGTAPTVDDIRARMEERGLSAEEIDDRVARMEEARANFEAGTLPADGTFEMPEDFAERMAAFRERFNR